ncbi:uncharacterized protein ANIA_10629 [Aspergillus nidulans FGSC A4]|uniref:Fatty acid desaturase domain-containing protein n=1 Tax=Emericella nidulans (strain FGSC A4 / ATCC 38163 / CBS 112.46 / NRRL 194 / M139) TaxID=227321 RepID=C8V7Z1_EMENI|nr:hypothetical protein [Aspergillus nidulans FGSC A4]CBF76117.1 TPA: conserved hypothetical protein [Aspergillus nidulans FGSC A4]
MTFLSPTNSTLTLPDLLVLETLLGDAESTTKGISLNRGLENCRPRASLTAFSSGEPRSAIEATIKRLKALNDPNDSDFDPTVVLGWDRGDFELHPFMDRWILQPYAKLAREIVRVETDVVIITHVLLYFTTSFPSAILLFQHFHWIHGLMHWAMQAYLVGTYTLMMHQHIHMGGLLKREFLWFDTLFPYIMDPLMGHTWNSYYYHHVKHHHVEGNGPDDLSSTIRYQRDELFDFLCYISRFLFLTWLELPLYFVRKGKFSFAFKTAAWEFGYYIFLYLFWRYICWKATIFVFILPLLQLRLGLMVGNWGQHAFVDEANPKSDFRSSVTVIDVASNRFCYNDGYHTSHHLNPLRHWREHPVSFLQQKDRYSAEDALVFQNIDYIMITNRLLQKDYKYLAECLVPIGNQVGMTVDELAIMLRKKTRRFSAMDIRSKF